MNMVKNMNKEEWFDKYLSQANQDIQYCEEHHCLKEFVAGLLENENAKNEIIKSQEKAQISLQNELVKLQQENKQLKDNWNKLKNYLSENITAYGYKTRVRWLSPQSILSKMFELENGDSNE